MDEITHTPRTWAGGEMPRAGLEPATATYEGGGISHLTESAGGTDVELRIHAFGLNRRLWGSNPQHWHCAPKPYATYKNGNRPKRIDLSPKFTDLRIRREIKKD